MKSSSPALRGTGGPLVVLAMIVLCQLAGAILEPVLQYDRALLQQGELWRLFSAHLVHANFHHFLLNSVGLGLLWILHGPHYRTGTFIGLTLLIALVCSAALYLFSPATDWYLGLSGVLHGLIVWGGYRDIGCGMKTGYLLVAGTWCKIGYEQLLGGSRSAAELIGVDVSTDAHLYGAAAGSLVCLLCMAVRVIKRSEAPRPAPGQSLT